MLKFCALFCAPGMISYHLLIRFPFGSYFTWLFGLPLTESQHNLRDRTGNSRTPKMSILAVCNKLVANQGKKENQKSYFWTLVEIISNNPTCQNFLLPIGYSSWYKLLLLTNCLSNWCLFNGVFFTVLIQIKSCLLFVLHAT